MTYVPSNKVLAALERLNKYNWFVVDAENTTRGKATHFCATGIELTKYCIRFDRQFSTRTYSDNRMIDVSEVAENKFAFLSEAGTRYTIEGQNKNLASPYTSSGSKENPVSLIDWERSSKDYAGNTMIVLDLRKLGELCNTKRAKIKSYLNVQMKGLALKKQVCRTIYFYKSAENPSEIYAGMYNLETEQPTTKILFDAERFSCMYDEQDQVEKNRIRQMMDFAGSRLGAVVPQF